jgi:arylsulfatase A-like enzyme
MAKNSVLPASLPTIASVLAEGHVQTAAVVTNYNLEPAYGFARGFADYVYLAPARYLGAPPEAYRLAAYETYRLLRERYVTFDRQQRYFYRSGAAVSTRALGMLDAVGDKDFFLYLHYMEAHDPYFAVTGESYARVSSPKPPVSLADPMREAYRDGVQRFDTYFGMLRDGLDERHLTERTTIIVVADHGEEFADHGGFYHGLTLYEEMLHVPLLISGPGIAAGTDDRLVRQIDLGPTVLGRFGAKAPTSWEGKDIFAGSERATISIAEENHEGNVLRAIRTGNDKLIVANPDNPRGLAPSELYDLGRDPREKYPLHTEAVAARLLGVLENALNAARRGGAHATTHDRDAASEAELRALGYVQ